MTGVDSARQQLHAPFRPIRARRVAWSVCVVQGFVLVVVALTLPWSGPAAFGPADRIGVVAVGGLVGWMLYRFAQVRAVPTETGLVVHNLLRSTDLQWAQVVAVRFGGGNPWVTLDLSDGESLAVMAIQRADGPAGQGEAQRLSTLVALHGRNG